MTHASHISEHIITRHLSTRCLWLCIAIVMLIAGAVIVIDESSNIQAESGSRINISGRQRMLSQRMILTASQLVNATADRNREQFRTLLRNDINMMETSHDGLLFGNKNMGLSTHMSDPIHALYTKPDHGVDPLLRQTFRHARQLADTPPDQLNVANSDYQQLVHNAPHLLASLDRIVNSYELETLDAVTDARHIAMWILCTAIIILVAGYVAWLKPAIRRSAEAYDQIVSANKSKSAFLSSMSHELRTPMNGIIGTTELMLGSDLNYKQQQYAQTILHSGEALLSIITDILDFSSIEAGNVTLNHHSFNLENMMRDVIQIHGLHAREKQLELIMHYTPGTPKFIISDAARMRQIITHLVGHAIKLTPYGHVLVSIEQSMKSDTDSPATTWFTITIDDTSAGVTTAQRQLIENVNSNSKPEASSDDDTTVRQQAHADLELTLSAKLIAMMGGTLDISNLPYRGARYQFTIPTLLDNDATEFISTPDSLQGLTVLLVDDLEANRILIRDQLEGMGMHCTTCDSGDAALDLLQQAHKRNDQYDMAVLDFMMPNMDGESLAKLIKADPALTDIPLTILTSLGEQGYVHRFMEAGFAAILSKPARLDMLQDTLAATWHAYQHGTTSGLVTIEGSILAQQHRTPPPPAQDTKPLAGFTVLLAEDNRINRALATEMLDVMGATVIHAANGDDAVNIVRDTPDIDMILMDCHMPVMDGFEATQRIRTLAKTTDHHIPIIAFTGNSGASDYQQCLACGMDDVVVKPIRKKDLLHVATAWLLSDDTPNTVSSKHHDIIIDHAVTSEAHAMMGARFTQMLTYFYDDTTLHIADMRNAIESNAIKDIARIAHSCKSASKSLGAISVSKLAKDIEFIARDNMSGTSSSLPAIIPLLTQMDTALADTKCAMDSYLAHQSSQGAA